MNALGGTRGERNAKPKFAALDINKLYSTSRVSSVFFLVKFVMFLTHRLCCNLLQGESLEPSTQKSAAPRKHGMQSLGKVPSARRPPANLPSLKAEISTPSDQQGTWGNETGDNQNNNSSITTAPATSSVASSTNNNATVGTTGVHTSSYTSNQQILHSNSTSSSSQWNSVCDKTCGNIMSYDRCTIIPYHYRTSSPLWMALVSMVRAANSSIISTTMGATEGHRPISTWMAPRSV